jgi:hypothetical protein
MIDALAILFVVVGGLALYPIVGIIRDQYKDGRLFDETGAQASHDRFVRGCVAFVLFYLTILVMIAVTPLRPYVMLALSIGFLLFTAIYVVNELGREELSPLLFRTSVAAKKGTATYFAAAAWNLLFVAAGAFWVLSEYRDLSTL